MVNRVILIGNLGRDPELRHLEGGVAVAKIAVATNENYKDKSGEWQTNTEWHDVVLWRNMAERAEQTLKKGSMVYVEGKLTHRKWQDSEGRDRYTTEVVASYIRAINRSDGSPGSSNFPGADSIPPENKQHVATDPNQTNSAVDTGEENDDLPF